MTQTITRTFRLRSKSALRIAIAITGAMALTACSSGPRPPNEALQAADQAIESAEQARVADYASPELGVAREKLNEARLAVQREDMELAQRLAEQSRVAAELALAQAQASKATVVNDEMKKSTKTIKQEMQRNPGVNP